MNITKEKLEQLLVDYFGLDNKYGSYFYTLTRDKEAFEIDTMTFDDFVEFDEELIEDLTNYLWNVL